MRDSDLPGFARILIVVIIAAAIAFAFSQWDRSQAQAQRKAITQLCVESGKTEAQCRYEVQKLFGDRGK